MPWPLIQALLLCFRVMISVERSTVAALRADLEPAAGRLGRGPGLRVGCINEQRAVAHEKALLRVQHAHELVRSLLRVPALQKLVEGPTSKQQAGRLCWQHPACRVGDLALIWGIDGPALQSGGVISMALPWATLNHLQQNAASCCPGSACSGRRCPAAGCWWLRQALDCHVGTHRHVCTYTTEPNTLQEALQDLPALQGPR